MEEVSSISEIQAVTENHDPNGNLNKSGGYTSSVYFSVSSLNNNSTNDDVVDIGVDGGGCIEVYKSSKDAQKRAQKLKILSFFMLVVMQ